MTFVYLFVDSVQIGLEVLCRFAWTWCNWRHFTTV